MAIAPIDLQTLFTQMDKVGKTQAAQKEGQVVQQAIHGEQIQKKTEELIRQVNETQNTGDGAEKINDRTQKQKQDSKNNNSGKEENETDESDQNKTVNPAFNFRDPRLGNRIDIRQ